MKIKKLLPVITVVFSILVSGCTSGDRAKLLSYGTPATVQCFSGGKMVYNGKSTGIVQSEGQSDGWYFTEASTGDLVMVTGNCVIRHKTR